MPCSCEFPACLPPAWAPLGSQVTGLRWCHSGRSRQKKCWEMAISWCPCVSGQCQRGSRGARETCRWKGCYPPIPPRSTPLDLICSRRSRFCVGEAVSCLKHKTAAHAGCSCSAGELESHKTLGAAALSLKGVKNLGERKKSFLLEGCAALGPPPHLPEMDLALV